MLLQSLNQVELKKIEKNVTGRVGISWVHEVLKHIGFFKKIDELKPLDGRSNRELATSVKLGSEILSRIDGASVIEDVEVIRKDFGLERILGKRIVSADTIRNVFKERELAECQKAANKWLIVEAMKRAQEESFTYDNDATYCESAKDSASWSYRETKDHSALLGFITELSLCATMDFRTGSVSPRDGITEQIQEVIKMAEAAGKRIGRVRLDSAGHNNKIFELCKKHKILLYLTLANNSAVEKIVKGINEAEWAAIEETDRECAQSVYVTEKGFSMRLIALRWRKKQGDLFGGVYGYHVIGTTDNDGTMDEIISIHGGRMGSENYNKELKNGYSCDWSPSHDFTINMNYFYAGVIAYNCVEIVKRFFIRCDEVSSYRIKKLRHWFVKISGKLVKTGRKYYFHVINATEKSYAMIYSVWQRLQFAW